MSELSAKNELSAIDSNEASTSFQKQETAEAVESGSSKFLKSNKVSIEKDNQFFQLTYEPNPSLPFVIDCLKLQRNVVYGNHVITDKLLNIGDVVAIEKPFFGITTNNDDDDTFIEKDSAQQRCHHCFQSSNMSLISCDNCSSVKFCSNSCKDDAMEIYHNYECHINNEIPNVQSIVRSMRSFFVALYLYDGDIDAIKEHFERRGSKVSTVFDFDLSDPKISCYDLNLMDVFDSYKASEKNISFPMIDALFNCHPELAAIWKGNELFIHKFLARHADNLRELGQVMVKWPENAAQLIAELPKTNKTFPINSVRKIVGLVYYPFVGLINHSCVPNVIRHINEQNQMVLIVCRPIYPGKQLFVDYTGNLYFCKVPKIQRLKELLENYSFVCSCLACSIQLSTLFPLLKDQIINNGELIQMTADAIKGFKTWSPKKAKENYLHILEMLIVFYSPIPTKEYCFLQEWFSIVLALTARPNSSF